jgi:hypothetical protein
MLDELSIRSANLIVSRLAQGIASDKQPEPPEVLEPDLRTAPRTTLEET